MKTYLNLVTGKTVVAKSLKNIKGNIVNRGLSKDYLLIDSKANIALEYSRLIKSLEKSLLRGELDNVGIRNIKKGIKDTRRWLDEI